MTTSFRADDVKPAALDPITPRFLPVTRRIRETADTVSLEIETGASGDGERGFRPGQFNMLYAYGVGEIPVSISGDPAIPGRMVHTVRSVGPASEALTKLKRGDVVGIRGPFGSSWPLEEAAGFDVLVIAGGIGLAPVRPVLYHLLKRRAAYGRRALLYGARSQQDLLYVKELDTWRRTPDFQVRVTLNHAEREWTGDVGHVTGLLGKVRFDPADTIAMLCGPEVMLRSTALALIDSGVPAERIFISMERNMKCATGFCGHCQFGPYFICKDGAVFRYDHVRDLLTIREL